MFAPVIKPDFEQKLELLSRDSQYDLACACGTSNEERRKRGQNGKWIYPVTMPNGQKRFLFKTLLSNVCTSDCKYCPLRSDSDIKRVSLTPDETARAFIDYYNQRLVSGLFLSSAVIGCPEKTMTLLNDTAHLLRKKYRFKGYIHLKVIPGSSDAAIEQALKLATAVSVNIETPGAENLEKLSKKKRYIEDIIASMKLISKLTKKGSPHQKVKQSTQFIVGPAGETDQQIVKYTQALYQRLKLCRVYFSAYQNHLGDPDIPIHTDPDKHNPGQRNNPPKTSSNGHDIITREHRLYQVDFLLRKYGFDYSELVFDTNGKLSLEADPKEVWAKHNPQFFPVNANTAKKMALLRVPGIGSITADNIISRRISQKLRSVQDIGRLNKRLLKASEYLIFS